MSVRLPFDYIRLLFDCIRLLFDCIRFMKNKIKTSVFDIHDMRTVKKHYTIEIYAAIMEGKKHWR